MAVPPSGSWRAAQTAQAHLKSGQTGQALEVIQKQLETQEDSALMLLAADIHASEGQTRQALEYYRAAHMATPTLRIAHQNAEKPAATVSESMPVDSWVRVPM